MKLSALILVALLIAPAGAQEKPSIEESTKKIKELQKERIETLEKVVGRAIAQFQRATSSYQDVLEAQTQLLQARLDTAEKESERIELYTKAIELLKQTEKVAQAQIAAGRETEMAALKIKARRLDVEIKLEQAKIKEAKEKK